MKRNLTFEEISDGKRYSANDLAKISCNGCDGCSECCKVTDDTILLDPYDIYELSAGLSKTFEEMLGYIIDLTVIDGVITPYLMKNTNLGDSTSKPCVFLDTEGRCEIHAFRPGFCRMFPLGRIYNDDGDFDYFIQVHECPYPHKSKVKISKWLDIPRLADYEAFIKEWHEITKNISECAVEDPTSPAAKMANAKMLQNFFVAPYDSTIDFYSQFKMRTTLWKKL